MERFKGQVIWVIGASSGYGEALARALADAGALLILSARRYGRLRDIAASLTAQAKVVPLDLAEPEAFDAKVAAAIACFGHIDRVIFTGAVAQNGTALATTPETARHIMAVDYVAYTELTRSLLPHFLARESGHIVVTSGLLATLTLPGRSSYAAAKAALHGYFGCLRAEVLSAGIAVTLLVPGALDTELTRHALNAAGEALNTPPSGTGCAVAVAAEQSLQAIAAQVYEAYIGIEDASYRLWRLTRADPNKGMAMLLASLPQVNHK